jgi:O-Antigen ligase
VRYASVEEHASAKAEFGLIWLLYALGSLAVLALVAKPGLIALAAVAVVFGMVAYRFPELLLVLFVAIGPLKATDVGQRMTVLIDQLGQSTPIVTDLTVLAALALAAALCLSLWRHRDEEFAVPRAALAFLGLAVLLLLGVPRSPAPDAGLAKALMFVTLASLAFFAPLVIVRSRASLYRTLALVVALAIPVGLSAEAPERSESVLVLPGADNQIQLGLLLGLGVVSIVGYLWPASSGPSRLLWLLPAGFLLVKLFSAGGRSALIGTLLACSVALALLLISGRRHRLAALALIGVLAALVPAAWAMSGPAVKDRYLTTIADLRGGAGLDAGGADRGALADAAVEVFAANPLGAGTGAYPALTGYEWPHNIVLELGSELGVFGVAALIVLIAGIAVTLRGAARSPTVRGEVIGAGSLLLLPLTVAFSSFDLNGNRTLWFACGLALATARLRP